MVVEELLHNLITTAEFQSYSPLMNALEDQSSQSRSTKLSVNNLINAFLIMMLIQMMMPYL